MLDTCPFSFESERMIAKVDSAAADIASMRRRHDAFIAALDDKGRVAAGIAAVFFGHADSAVFYMKLSESSVDLAKRNTFLADSLECSKCAYAQFKRFGEWMGCRDDAETTSALDRLIELGRKNNWPLEPAWWAQNREKSTAYFLNRIKIRAGKRDAIEHEYSTAAKKAPPSRKAHDDLLPDPHIFAEEGGAI